MADNFTIVLTPAFFAASTSRLTISIWFGVNGGRTNNLATPSSAFENVAAFSKSNSTSSTAGPKSFDAFALSRIATRTLAFFCASRFTTSRPIVPVAPVTRIASLINSRYSDSRPKQPRALLLFDNALVNFDRPCLARRSIRCCTSRTSRRGLRCDCHRIRFSFRPRRSFPICVCTPSAKARSAQIAGNAGVRARRLS
jgi:hypothetical protein